MVFNSAIIDAELLSNFLISGSKYLDKYKEEVNALNVFPVPDGDTGINMHLTVSSGANKITQECQNGGVGKVAADFALGTLMGARGNSGVILSQMFRGFSLPLAGKKECSVQEIAAAMKKGSDLAYKSVMKPAEGTILTVFKKFTIAAITAAEDGADFEKMLEIAIKEGEKALDNTPNQLAVLKEAGVVDAGGAGLLIFMRGGLAVLQDGQISDAFAKSLSPATFATSQPMGAARDDISTADMEFIYCTQLLIKGENMPIDEIRDHLMHEPPGDSLLAVGDESVIKIHFHNNHPGQVLEYCSAFGSIHDIVIDNMIDQHHETMAAGEYTPTASEEKVIPENLAQCGVIAICAGEGMAAIYNDLGASVISGGQTMNPSAEDILNMIDQVAAKEVVILPNNSNIILAAEQAKSLAKKPVAVAKSKFVTQGISSMLVFDHDQSAEDNSQAMEETFEQIINGELTYAVRSTDINGKHIKKNDFLALLNGEIVLNGRKLEKQLVELVSQMETICNDCEIISLYWGKDVEEEEANRLAKIITDKFPDHEIELYNGGQPLYYFLLSVE